MAEVLIARLSVQGVLQVRVFIDDVTREVVRVAVRNAGARSRTLSMTGDRVRSVTLDTGDVQERDIPVPNAGGRDTNLKVGIV